MRELFAIEGAYDDRCTQLKSNGVALWDVLAQSVRRGSLDSDIQVATSETNDFEGFFEGHRSIELVCFNGQKAAQLFSKLQACEASDTALRFATLPSTSPAYASMSFAQKLDVWRNILCE